MNDSREYDTQQITEESVVEVNGSSLCLAYGSKKTLTSWIPHSAIEQMSRHLYIRHSHTMNDV